MPQLVKNGKRFIMKTSTVNGSAVSEKIIVNSRPGYSVSYGDIINNVEGKLKKLSHLLSLCFKIANYRR